MTNARSNHSWRRSAIAAAALFTALANASTAVAQTPSSSTPRLDHGYTLFELFDTEESENGARVWRGYSVAAHYRVFGTVARGSAMLSVFKQGGREVGRVRCEGTANDVSNDPAWAGMTFECRDYAQRLRVVGALTVETTLINGQTDAQTPLRTHTLEVREVAQAGVSPTHYVSRHQEALSGWISWHSVTGNAYSVNGYFSGVTVPSNAPTMALILPVAGTSDTVTAIEGARLRCTRNGQPVTLPDGDEISDARGARSVRLSQSLSNGSGGSTQVGLGFHQLALRLPFTFGATTERSATNLTQNPGRWQCDLRSNGEVVRTFAFTAGADGLPVAHAEQSSGLYLGPRASLVDITIPAAGASNERTAPAEVRAGGFYGRAWTSDALRTAAAAVPALGVPHLLASQPASARTASAPAPRRRGRR
jgi:hypothetical protein